MSEAELLEQFSMFMGNYLAGVSVSFAVVSAYIGALHFFLRDSSVFLRLVSFVFFTGILGTLGLFMIGSYRYFVGIRSALNELSASADLTPLGQAALTSMNDSPATVMVYAAFALGCGIHLALFIMTFFYRWRVVARASTSVSVEAMK